MLRLPAIGPQSRRWILWETCEAMLPLERLWRYTSAAKLRLRSLLLSIDLLIIPKMHSNRLYHKGVRCIVASAISAPVHNPSEGSITCKI